MTAPATGVIRIGTRGSALARTQAALVDAALRKAGVGPTETVTLETAGDRRRPDTAWGEGAFVAAIEDALRDGRVDVAVHSAKDVPTTASPDLVISAYLPREDPRDALVVRTDDPSTTLADLPAGSRVGTDSPRRTGFVLAARPDLTVHPLAGNVDTRLRRLDAAETDALILAVAGLARLGRTDRISEVLDPSALPPAPGQGAIAVQVRTDDRRAADATAAIDDRPTRITVEAERAFLAASGGGCRAPIGALATIEDGELVLRGGYARPDGSATAHDEVRGSLDEGAALGELLAKRLGSRLPGVSDRGPDRPRVLVTRAAGQADDLADRLAAVGLEAVIVPTIAIEANDEDAALDAAVGRLASYDWLVVTSANGARAIVSAAARADVEIGRLRWAAVGAATSRVLEEAGATDVFKPPRATGAGMAEALPVRPGSRVLLIRGNRADDRLPTLLSDQPAHVEEVVAYRTVEAPGTSGPMFRRALEAGPVAAVLFTSRSTVRGLAELSRAESLDVRSVPALSIGPETTTAARRAGYLVIGESPTADSASLAALAARLLLERPEPS